MKPKIIIIRILIIKIIIIDYNFKEDYDFNSGRREGRERTFREAPKGGAQKGGGAGWGEGWCPEGQKFALFSVSRHNFRSLCQLCLFGLLGCRVNPRQSPPCFVPPNVNISGLWPSTPAKFHEKTPKRGKNERKWERETEKKSAKFWAVLEEGGPGGGPLPSPASLNFCDF